MIPHTLVLKPGLVVHSIYNGYWFWGRPSIADLSRSLHAARARSAPTGISSAPGLRWRRTPALVALPRLGSAVH